jgi:hypothetical protein
VDNLLQVGNLAAIPYCGICLNSCGTSVAWCGMVRMARNAAFRRNAQAFAACCSLFAYAADLRLICGVKVGIRGMLNWTAEE